MSDEAASASADGKLGSIVGGFECGFSGFALASCGGRRCNGLRHGPGATVSGPRSTRR